MGSGSTSRISLPTNWSCRLRPPHAVIDRACADRVDEAFGQRGFGRELGEAFRIERDQGLAQVLQRVHLGLAPRLRRRKAVRRRVGGRGFAGGRGVRAGGGALVRRAVASFWRK